MSNQVALLENSQRGELTVESITALIKAGIVPDGTPKSQIQIFAQVCQEKGISPFSKEVYLLCYAGKYSIITGIEGFRKIAARTNQFCGCDDAKFDLKADGTFKTIADFKNSEMPNTCTITVYRLMGGVRCPFTHTAKFSEFSSGKQKWLTMPFQMISKVAEAFALRKAFGDATSGISIEEEAVAISDAQSNTLIIKPKTEEEMQAEQNRLVDSEIWLTSFKEMFIGLKDYDTIKNLGNELFQGQKIKNLVPLHIDEFKSYVKELLAKYQNVEA